jgi:uncharacterized protein with PIN domain
MNCPLCNVPMIRGDKLECATGNARKFICPKCRAWHWQQEAIHDPNFRPLRRTLENLGRLAEASV